ncbi:hypothetical protein R83H12_02576 [Fibrobacteria bacterium R8-3-H12]
MHKPFWVLPALPVLCTAFCMAIRCNLRVLKPTEESSKAMRSKPESITTFTFGMVSDVSAMFVVKIILVNALGSNIFSCSSFNCPPKRE